MNVLDIILTYYRLHINNFKNIKSIEIIKSSLAKVSLYITAWYAVNVPPLHAVSSASNFVVAAVVTDLFARVSPLAV